MSLAEFEALIPDYVGGRMQAATLPRFEEALLANPTWAQLVEAEHCLRAGIRELAQRDPSLFE